MKILVSSCLLGEKVRYDGNNSTSSINSPQLFSKIIKSCKVYSVCPEHDGGLQIPREPAEIIGDNIINKVGQDVTHEFLNGAKIALDLCKKENIKIALLKAKSPSCGNNKIYDGSFTNTLIDGTGVTVKLLSTHNIKVFNETQLEELELFINQMG